MADEIRRRAGVPLNVNSGVRCKRHNAEVGGVSNSLHTTGQAVDLSGAISPEKLYAIAQEVQAEKIPGRGGLGCTDGGFTRTTGSTAGGTAEKGVCQWKKRKSLDGFLR